jgi:multidrug efflux system outer membrane protein
MTLAAITVISGCRVGPNYKRPATTVPPAYRDVDVVSQGGNTAQPSLGDLKWSEIFQDEPLKSLISEALQNNYDVRIAAQRVLEQQAEVGITRSQMFPSVSAGGSYITTGLPSGLLGNPSSPKFNGGGLSGSASWYLDFWGLYRRQTEAARAELVATEWGRRAALCSVVINVAGAYIQLRALDEQLRITRATLAAREESLRLVSLRESYGATTVADVYQAQQLLYAAQSEVPRLEREIRQQENGLSLLLGRNPGPIPRGKQNTEQPHPLELVAGLPRNFSSVAPTFSRRKPNW